MVRSEEEVRFVYDKTDGCCAYCGKRLSLINYGIIGARGAWHIDHSVPKSRGGTDYLRNLVPACIDCNLDKGDRSGRSYKASLARLESGPSTSRGPDLGDLIIGGLLLGVVLAFLTRPKRQS